MPEKMARQVTHPPNKWKQWLLDNNHAKTEKLKGPAKGHYSLPAEVENMVTSRIASLAEGENEAMARAEPIRLTDVAETLKMVCAQYNEKVEAAAEKSLESAWSQIQIGFIYCDHAPCSKLFT